MTHYKCLLFIYCFQLVNACYFERVDLSAHGFYIVPDIGFDWATGKGNPFRYFTYGAAFAEVEIDTLTGDFHTRAADVILDLGFSINPALDVGQVPNVSFLLSLMVLVTFLTFILFTYRLKEHLFKVWDGWLWRS